jgi:hypothetical protein
VGPFWLLVGALVTTPPPPATATATATFPSTLPAASLTMNVGDDASGAPTVPVRDVLAPASREAGFGGAVESFEHADAKPASRRRAPARAVEVIRVRGLGRRWKLRERRGSREARHDRRRKGGP